MVEIKWRGIVKRDVLSFYGKDMSLRCCWPGCDVSDPDVLTLDHIDNNGAAHRKETGLKGAHLYKHLKDHDYPSGYQTLCMNHQLKKEIRRKRDVIYENIEV